MATIPLTQRGAAQLKAELQRLKTVERHASSVFRKLGVSSRAGATAQAISLGLVDGAAARG